MVRNPHAGEEELRHLMVRYQGADPHAVDELVDRLSPMLLRFLGGPYRSKSDAEDLLQDCWLRIHQSRHTYRPSEPVLPWIFAIARHTQVDDYRRRRRLGSREVLVADVPEVSRSAEPPDLLEREELFRFVDALPEAQREVVLMLKVSGMSLAEVARATSSTAGAIKQKAHRAYAKLRLLLQKDVDNDRRTSHRMHTS
jgi:RNA polymerase sigma-70 factor (ECF subfamily)